MYVENIALTEYINNTKKQYQDHQKYLMELHNQKQPSDTIHIVLINNVLHNSNRDRVLNKINELINTNKNEHLIVVYYGEEVKNLCPVVPLIDNIHDSMAKIIQIDYDYTENFTMEDIKKTIKSCGVIGQMDFSFLSTYQLVFVYE